MGAGDAPPLRTSCERCRSQKLRCIPSSDTDFAAPCERCTRAKLAEWCVYGRRSRMGRQPKTSNHDFETLPAASGKMRRKTHSTPVLPGMSGFTLSATARSKFPFSTTFYDGYSTPIGTDTPCETDLQERANDQDNAALPTNLDLEQNITHIWEEDHGSLNPPCRNQALLEPSGLTEANVLTPPFLNEPWTDEVEVNMTANLEMPDDFEFATRTNLPGTWHYPPSLPFSHTNVALDMQVPVKSSPLIDMNALLADMLHHENQLSKLSGGSLDDYPIGDSLFFSQRFHGIALDSGEKQTSDYSPLQDVSIVLLNLSCYMALIRIHSRVFSYLHDHLSQLPEASSSHNHDPASQPSTAAVDIHAYRGRRLGQLQPVCLCARWSPVKKAVLMLRSTLAATERALGLPPDVSVTAMSGRDWRGDGGKHLRRYGGGRMMLSEEGLIAALTDGRLYKTMSEQAIALRRDIDKVDELLSALLET